MSSAQANWPVDSAGIWRQYLGSPDRGAGRPSPIVFLDRDGVIVEEVHYLHRIDEIRIYPASLRFVQAARARGWRIVIVTNQAGIGRGYYGWAEFQAVNTYLLESLAAAGAGVDAVLAAPHHGEGLGAFKVDDHPMRKPNPGMLLDALSHFGSDPARCVVVGDRTSDLAAGRSAGLRHGVLVRTGYGQVEEHAARALDGLDFHVEVADDLGALAKDWLDRVNP